ncbi:MAG: MarR family transcriptional regulator [Actinomycetota bacterium]
MAEPRHDGTWTFLTNHSHVLICLRRDPELRLRDIGELVGITERSVFNIVNDLEAAGYLERRRVGRRNQYVVLSDRPMRHVVEQGRTVEELLRAMADGP